MWLHQNVFIQYCLKTTVTRLIFIRRQRASSQQKLLKGKQSVPVQCRKQTKNIAPIAQTTTIKLNKKHKSSRENCHRPTVLCWKFAGRIVIRTRPGVKIALTTVAKKLVNYTDNLLHYARQSATNCVEQMDFRWLYREISIVGLFRCTGSANLVTDFVENMTI